MVRSSQCHLHQWHHHRLRTTTAIKTVVWKRLGAWNWELEATPSQHQGAENKIRWADVDDIDEEDLQLNADTTQLTIAELTCEEPTNMEESTYEDDDIEFIDDNQQTVEQ